MNRGSAHDIVPTPTRQGVGTDFSLSMSLGNRGREATPANAVSMAARFGLSQKEALLIIEEMKARVGAWKDHFTEQADTPADLDQSGTRIFGQ
jgi:serine/threonine-protein kinase HipA